MSVATTTRGSIAALGFEVVGGWQTEDRTVLEVLMPDGHTTMWERTDDDDTLPAWVTSGDAHTRDRMRQWRDVVSRRPRPLRRCTARVLRGLDGTTKVWWSE